MNKNIIKLWVFALSVIALVSLYANISSEANAQTGWSWDVDITVSWGTTEWNFTWAITWVIIPEDFARTDIWLSWYFEIAINDLDEDYETSTIYIQMPDPVTNSIYSSYTIDPGAFWMKTTDSPTVVTWNTECAFTSEITWDFVGISSAVDLLVESDDQHVCHVALRNIELNVDIPSYTPGWTYEWTIDIYAENGTAPHPSLSGTLVFQ